MDANFNRVNESTERAVEQAGIQLDGIEYMVDRLRHTEECGHTRLSANGGTREACDMCLDKGIDECDEYHDQEAAREAILGDPLSVEVRSAWHTPGAIDACAPYEYKILLCWGGPSVQIIGELDDRNEPYSARLQYQDWFTEWTDYPLTQWKEELLLKYAQQFSFDL
jgi:hypothetical protein